jgi:subtilisin family serine protease
MKMVGVAGAGSALVGTAGGATGISTRTLDEQFDLGGGVQEALVVFDDSESARRLETLDLPETYHVFEHLDVAWTSLTADQLETVAGWDSVRRVKAAEELEWHNDDTSRESMAIDTVHNAGYEGEDAHVVIIDSGLNASHPGIGADRVEANYRYVDEPTGPRDPFWVDTNPGDTDTIGHGQHCAGIAAGDGEGGTQGSYEGVAPEATITSYAVVQYIYLPYVVAAWNHLLGRIRTEPEFDPDVVTNSYGVARGARYNPNDPVNVATWKVFQEGVLPVFSYGNDGSGEGTGSRFAKAPHVLGVGAAEKTIDEENNNNNRPIVGFSSRGRSDVDDVFYDRDQLLQNLRRFFAIQEGTTRTIRTDTFTGSVGPGANTDPVLAAPAFETDTGSSYENFTTAGNADLVDLTLSLDPEGQWVRMRVYEDQDGEWVEVAQMREEVLKQHDTLTVDVEGSTDYVIELEPEDTVTADYTVEYTSYTKPDGDLSDARPITMYRPGVSAHGNAVLSTQDKADVLGPLGEAGDAEPFYGRLSGTSMSCPAAAGVAMLVQQAYRAESGGQELSTADVIRVIEHAAADHNPNYTTVSTGAGFVDAEVAVETAEALASGSTTIDDLETGLDALVEPPAEVTPPEEIDLEPSGSRSDDGSAFTGGQTNRVVVTVEDFNDELTNAVKVTDTIPSNWDVDEEYGDVESYDGGMVTFEGTVSADEVAGDGSVDLVYFAEAPEGAAQTGAYGFGPAEAEATDPREFQDDSERTQGSTTGTFGGTDTNTVAGADTS